MLDARDVERAVVAGHSWGGHLALHLAVSHPGRVSGLLLVDGLGVIGSDGVDGLTAELEKMGQELEARMLPAAAARFRELTGQLGGADPTDEQDAEIFRQLWPSHFTNPASAPSQGSFQPRGTCPGSRSPDALHRHSPVSGNADQVARHAPNRTPREPNGCAFRRTGSVTIDWNVLVCLDIEAVLRK
ncbi:MAG: alpha/beta hydrolase [Actinomycetota bacterium]|nr:alpha/beta hydrolase [Actinomycetota bacterium]